MKKLMIAAVAMAAGVAFAGDEITSANIVGYQQLTNNASGFTMVSPTFLATSSSTNCTLADLKVDGYDKPVQDPSSGRWSGGTAGKFYLQFLTSGGQMEVGYKWYDNGKKTGWYDSKGTTKITETDVKIPAGKGLWCQAAGLKLVPAGQVNVLDVSTTSNGSGFTPLGNPFPCDLTLDDLSVTGYDPPEQDPSTGRWSGGTAGKFYLQFLTSGGNMEVGYKWYDNGKKTGWYDSKGTTKIDATKILIPAGKGLWCQGASLKLVVNAPEL